jgi:hypothetical protein
MQGMRRATGSNGSTNDYNVTIKNIGAMHLTR